MNTKFLKDAGDDRIVYIRPVTVDELPAELRMQVDEDNDIHAILGGDGNLLALAPSRDFAFHLARENALAPHSVH